MLILMLLNLNICYADTDADLCIRIMSLCCTIYYMHVPAEFKITLFIYPHEIISLKSINPDNWNAGPLET